MELFLFAYFSPLFADKVCEIWLKGSTVPTVGPYPYQRRTYVTWRLCPICQIILSTTYSSVLFALCGVGLAGFALSVFGLVVWFAPRCVLSWRCLVLAFGACVKWSVEIVLGTRYSFLVTVLVPASKMRYGPDVRRWSFLYVKLAKVSASDSDVVSEGGL